MAMTEVIALLEAGDAAVFVAIITAVIGPVVALLVSSLRRIRQAAELAVHNTQPNGIPDENGEVGPPSSFDRIMASHEYMIGQIHAVAESARDATREATLARAAVKANDVKTDALAAKVDAGFKNAADERGTIAERIDRRDHDEKVFVEAAVSIVSTMLERIDRLDNRRSTISTPAGVPVGADEVIAGAGRPVIVEVRREDVDAGA